MQKIDSSYVWREFSVSLGFQYLTPSPNWESSQLWFVQVHLQPLSLSSSSRIFMIRISFCLIASLSSLILSSYSWIFYLFFLTSSFSIILSSNSPILSSASSVRAMATSILFYTSFIPFFSSSWLFLSSLISVAMDSLLSSILFSSPAINFIVIILNSCFLYC